MSSQITKTSITTREDGSRNANTQTRTPSPGTPASGSKVAGVNSGNGNAKIQAVFIHKLYDMLEDTSISHLIWWAPTNDSFYLLPGEEFSNALSQYFKHTNIASFIRQLNMYGFHKVNDTFQNDEVPSSSTANKWEFRHSTNQFRKGDLESLKLIKRRSSKNVNAHKEIINLKTIPTSQSVEHESSIDLSRREHYHQSLQKQHSVQAESSGSMSQPVQNTSPIFQGPQIQQPPPGCTGMVNPPSFDASVNYELLEYNNNLNNLRNDYYHLHTKYDALFKEFKTNQSDMLTLVDILERHKPAVGPTEISEKSKTSSPVFREEERSSPKPVEQIDSLSADLNNFRSSLLQRWNNDTFSPLTVQQHVSPQQTSPYHLNNHHSRHPSNSSIVPQQYPIHPQYTVYSAEPTFNNNNLDYQQKKNRNFSVFVDPLQATASNNQDRTYSPLTGMNPVPVQGTSAPMGSLMAQPQFQSPVPVLTPMKTQPQKIFHGNPDIKLIHKSNSFAGQVRSIGGEGRVDTLVSEKDSYFTKRRSLPTSEIEEQNDSNVNSPSEQSISNSMARSTPYNSSYVATADTSSTSSQARNQLPSVSELDRSIKVSVVQSPVYSLLNNVNDNINEHQITEEAHSVVKKRKI